MKLDEETSPKATILHQGIFITEGQIKPFHDLSKSCLHTLQCDKPLHKTEPYPGLVVVVAGDVGDDLLVLFGEGDPGDGPGVGKAVAVVDGLGLHDGTVDLPGTQT